MRLFIALDLPDAALLALTEMQLHLPHGLRLVPRENLHMTVIFLGDVLDNDTQTLVEVLESLRVPEIPLKFGPPSRFGGHGGQAVSLSVTSSPELQLLHDRIKSRFHGAGIYIERRRFRPHVTLARMPGRTDPGPALATLATARIPETRATSFSLVQSSLFSDGAQHETLMDFPLVHRPRKKQ